MSQCKVIPAAPEGTRFFHTDFGKGKLTVAYLREDTTNIFRFGFAFCSPKDDFCRATGRAKATYRLLGRQDSVAIPLPQDQKYPTKSEFLKAIVPYIKVPGWAKKDIFVLEANK